jgi:hypothetical protein
MPTKHSEAEIAIEHARAAAVALEPKVAEARELVQDLTASGANRPMRPCYS